MAAPPRPAVHGVVVAAATPRTGLRWLTALLDSHPRSLCLPDALDLPVPGRLRQLVQRSCQLGSLTPREREVLVEGWTRLAADHCPPWYFTKSYRQRSPLAQYLSWLFARARRLGRSFYSPCASPGMDQSFDLVVTQAARFKAAGPIALGLSGKLLVLRRHPCAVVASQLVGMRRGYLPALDRIRWFEENRISCQQLELNVSSVLRMPLGDLLAYRWLVDNIQLQKTVLQLPRTSLAVQLEDFCRQPRAAAENLFAFLGWELGARSQRFVMESTRGGWFWPLRWIPSRARYFTVYRHSTRACEAWREELTEYEQNRILQIAGTFPNFRRLWRD